MSLPVRVLWSTRHPARTASRKAGSPTNNRNENTPTSAVAAAKWIQRIKMSGAFTPGTTCSVSGCDLVGAGRKRLEGYAQERRILRIHLDIAPVYLHAAFVLNFHGAEGGLQLLGKRETQFGWRRADRTSDPGLGMVQKGMGGGPRGNDPTPSEEQDGTGENAKSPHLATSEEGFPEGMREHVIEVEVKLRNRAHVMARSGVRRNQRLEPDLEVGARPDDAGADDTGRKTLLTPVDRRLEVQFHQGDQSVKRRPKTNVQHARLQVRNAVLDGQAGAEHVRVLLHVSRVTRGLGLRREAEA